MSLYEHTVIVKQNHSANQLENLKAKYSKIIEKNEGEIIKIDDWGLLNLSHEINKNKKGNYIHFKLKGNGLTVSELEKNEKIDKNLLRFLTVRVKEFDLDKNYFKQENNSRK
jgi:small subunit ribosomal protein S6